MSIEFECRDWMEERLVKLKGSARSASVSGNGTPGIFLSFPKKDAFVPTADFCDLIRYFMTNTDLEKPDPRIELLNDLKSLALTEGYNGPNSVRLG